MRHGAARSWVQVAVAGAVRSTREVRNERGMYSLKNSSKWKFQL